MNNKNIYSWNPVYSFVINLKNEYQKKFGSVSDYNYDIPCLNYWANNIDNSYYSNVLKYLDINQYGNLVLIRYKGYDELFNMDGFSMDTFWDDNDGFYRECRSLVIDVYAETIVLCPFRKFRNVNESENDSLKSLIHRININHGEYEVTEKKDGSMQCATLYNGKIVMCGSQALDPTKSWRLEDGYRMMNIDNNLKRVIERSPGFTFIFEYVSLRDAHVVKYNKEEEGLYLIGIRDNYTGALMSYHDVIEIANENCLKTIESYEKTIDEILMDMKTYSCDNIEGYVIRVGDYMCKIKTDDYIDMCKILTKYASKNMVIHNIADGMWDDFYAKVPEQKKDSVLTASKIVFDFITKEESTTDKYYHYVLNEFGSNKKDFMIGVAKSVPKKYSGYVINKYLGRDNNYIKSSNGRYKKWAEISSDT